MNKKLITGIIIGGIIFGSIGVYAASKISANSITYNDTTVEDALNELYNATNTKKYENGEVVYYNPETNKKCKPVESTSTTGTKTGCMKWYTFNDEEGSATVNLILDHNTTAEVAWNSTNSNSEMKEVQEALTSDTSTWNSSLNARLITADEIAKITGNTSFDGSTSTGSAWFYLDSNSETKTATSKGASKYAWLFDYTYGCTSFGCNIEDNNKYAIYNSTSIDNTWGYWTSTPVTGSSNLAWLVSRDGILGCYYIDRGNNGVRPVITVSKSIIK